jgi:hypothetical protein
MAEFFSCTPEWFFQILKEDFSEFVSEPSARGLLRVVFWLCHLREWLCPGRGSAVLRRIRAKPEAARSATETLYLDLENMEGFGIVRALCNHAKHFEYQNAPLDGRMSEMHRARVGLARIGDSLGVTHFTVDGKEVRDFLWPVYKKYFDFFSPSSVAR